MPEDKKLYEITPKNLYGSPLLSAIDIPHRHNIPMQIDYRQFHPLGRLEYLKGQDRLAVAESAIKRLAEIKEKGYPQYSPSNAIPNAFITIASQRMPDISVIQYLHIPAYASAQFPRKRSVAQAVYNEKEREIRIATNNNPLHVSLEECVLVGRLHNIIHPDQNELRRLAKKLLPAFLNKDQRGDSLISPSLINAFMPIMTNDEGSLGMFGKIPVTD